jgi:hypothetical protein
LAANLSGDLYGFLAAWATTVADFPGVLAVGVGIAALVMCLQPGWVSFIPVAGTAEFFGTALSFWPTVLALVIRAGLGRVSAVLGSRLQARLSKPFGAPPTRDTNQPAQTA